MSEDKICAAYVAAFAEIEGAAKTAINPHFKSKYADLPTVIDAIKPHLSKHGLAFMQMPKPSEGGVAIETILIHSSGERLSMGVLFVPANKHDAHGYGSALSYARRYGLLCCFGLSQALEDDDGNAAVKSQQEAPDKPIVPTQFFMLQQLIEDTGTDAKAVAAHYKVPNLAMLPQSQFEAARALLQKKLTNV